MRIHAVVLVLIALGCQLGWAAQPNDPEATIRAAASAAASFSETRDAASVLDLYADDYQGIQDGDAETKDAVTKWLAEYESELRRGSRLRFLGTVSNVRIQQSGTLAWALYDYVFQAVRDGALEGQDTGKCTSLLREDSSRWVIFHEHCSKTRSESR